MRFVNLSSYSKLGIWGLLILMCLNVSCRSKRRNYEDEQLKISSFNESKSRDSLVNSIRSNVSLNQITTKPNAVLLTGLQNHRLVTIYKSLKKERAEHNRYESYSSSTDDYGSDPVGFEHFMPGIDIHYGYNLISLVHYDFDTEKLNSFFDHPVLVKTVYFPSFAPDSLNKKPISRNYYMVSVYDEDTNKDSLINKMDLRKIYHFDINAKVKTSLLPADYSAISSQYDSQNDAMYIFAKYDANKNGIIDENEPTHIFWISLKAPAPAKLMY